ncbi:MAG: hypothetical protein ACK4J0_03540, partial [Candidatus Anstonellaceae archaeon]
MNIKEVKLLIYSTAATLFNSIAYATTTPTMTTLNSSIYNFAGCIYSLLPPISMLLVIAAAVTFAA